MMTRSESVTYLPRNGQERSIYGIGLIYIYLFAANWFVNLFMNGDILTVLIWISFGLVVFKRDSKFFIKYFYMVFGIVAQLVGVFACENFDVYLTELARNTERHDSLLLIAFVQWLFCFCLWSFDQSWGKRISGHPGQKREEWYIGNVKVTDQILNALGIALLVFIVVSFAQIWNRPAFSFGYDRFAYSLRVTQGTWYSRSSGIIGGLMPIAALLLLRGNKKLPVVIVSASFVYFFWIGNKFGAFLNILYLLFPIFLLRGLNQKVIKKIAVAAGIVVVLLIGVVFLHNFLVYGFTAENNIEFFEQRVAQEGQLWWAAYEEFKGEPLPLDELDDEFRTYFTLDSEAKEEYNHGIYKIMRKVTPTAIFYNKVARGSRYTTSTHASIYYYFRVPGLIVSMPLLAALVCLAVNWYWRCLYAHSIVGCIVSARIVRIMNGVISMTDFDVLLSVETLAWLLLYALWVFFLSGNGVKKYRRRTSAALKTEIAHS